MKRTIIIAEAGVNHCGSLEKALEMVDVAADAGADYIKFQTFKAEELVGSDAALADYQARNLSNDAEAPISQLEMLKKLELTPADFHAIIQRCKQRKIKFMSTAFDLESVDFLASLGLDFWKIPSGEVTNYPYLQAIALHASGEWDDEEEDYDEDDEDDIRSSQPRTEKVVMSTGMCTLPEIDEALNVLTDNGVDRDDITLLHCTTEYPTPMQDVNLAAMVEMKRRFRLPVGYSDHTKGYEVAVAAVALGASVIEKHFTLSRDLPGPDHKASLLPEELKDMVRAIRNVERAIGKSKKEPAPSERKNIEVARRSIVASKPIKKGEMLTADNLTAKRPGTGMSPMKWPQLLGTKAARDYAAGEQIKQ